MCVLNDGFLKAKNEVACTGADYQVLRSIAEKTSQDHGTIITTDQTSRHWTNELVSLTGEHRTLNEFSIENGDDRSSRILVFLHGWGGGVGLYYKNFLTLSKYCKIYAIDLLGMGASSRPPFQLHKESKDARAKEAVDWFLEAIEEWRIKRRIKQMTLLGHSLGAYLAVHYALDHPRRVTQLILLSPVGILHRRTAGIPKPSLWLKWVWHLEISPFAVVRLCEPLGRWLVARWVKRTLHKLPLEESQLMCDYIHDIWRRPGSGEHALPHILKPGGIAYLPLVGVIQDIDVPIVFIYGQADWANIDGGHESACKIRATRHCRLRDGCEPVNIISGAGHYAQLQAPEAFNSIVDRVMTHVGKH